MFYTLICFIVTLISYCIINQFNYGKKMAYSAYYKVLW